MKLLTTLLVFGGMITSVYSRSSFNKMTNEKMNKILLRETSEVKGKDGNWQVTYKERPIFIITDSTHNRMRIISPVIEQKDLKEKDLKLLLEANFDRALDAKYSLFEEVLWSTYTHPLGELTVEQFKDALKQVATLANNYGLSYSSTDMVFGGGN